MKAKLMRRKKLAFVQCPRPPSDTFEMIVRINNIAYIKETYTWTLTQKLHSP